MMRVQFLTLASEEVGEVHRYYDLQQAGLGRQSVTEVFMPDSFDFNQHYHQLVALQT